MTATALILEVPEAEPLVSRWRTLYDPSAVAAMPAHITLIFPFMLFEQIDRPVLDTLSAVFSTTPRIDLQFSSTLRFPGVLWLAPDDPDPIVALVEALVSRFPERRPYGGAYGEIVPHLTIADLHRDQAPERTIDRIAREFHDEAATRLPVHAQVEAASLFRNEQGRWRAMRIFALRN